MKEDPIELMNKKNVFFLVCFSLNTRLEVINYCGTLAAFISIIQVGV